MVIAPLKQTLIAPRAPLTLRLKTGKQLKTTYKTIGNNFLEEDKEDKVGQVLFSWIRKVCPTVQPFKAP